MLARKTGSYQKPSAGKTVNAFLPKPGAVKHKITLVGGSQSYLKPREQETAPSLDRLGPFGNEAFACECSECFFCGVRATGDCLNWYYISFLDLDLSLLCVVDFPSTVKRLMS